MKYCGKRQKFSFNRYCLKKDYTSFYISYDSIFYGEKLLTTKNADASDDMKLLKKLSISPQQIQTGDTEEVTEKSLLDSINTNITDNKEKDLYYDAAAK